MNTNGHREKKNTSGERRPFGWVAGFVGAGGRLPKARRGRVLIVQFTIIPLLLKKKKKKEEGRHMEIKHKSHGVSSAQTPPTATRTALGSAPARTQPQNMMSDTCTEMHREQRRQGLGAWRCGSGQHSASG
jgi:hypothetical protein